MAIQYQVIPVQFSGGLDQKSPEQLVVPGKFLVLENCVRRKLGRIEKRYGFTELSSNIVGGSTLGSGAVLAKLNSDVLQVNENKIYSYTPSSDQWIDRGFISALTTETSPIIRNSDTQAMPDICSYSGLVATVWEDSRTSEGVKVSIFDEETGASILTDYVVSATGSRPKVIGIQNQFVITYIVGTSLNCKIVSTATPTTLGSEIVIDAGAVASCYDIAAWSSNYAVLAFRSSATEIELCYLTSAGAKGSAANALPPAATITYAAGDVLTIARSPDEDYIYIAATTTAGTNTDFWAFRASLLANDTISVSTTNATNATIGARTSGAIDVYTEFADTSNPYLSYVNKTVLNYDGTTLTTTTAEATFKKSVGLASKAFVSDVFSYVLTTFESALQSTFFIIRSDGFISSRNFAGLGGGLTRNTAGTFKSGLPRVTGSFITAAQVKNSFQADDDLTTLSSNAGLTQLSINLATPSYATAQLGENLHMAGGLLLNYDGNSVTEHGFNLFPENIVYTSPATGSLPAGDYWYQVTYEWVDAKGQIHRSAPSTLTPVTAVLNDSIVVVVPTLQLTQKLSPRSDVRIVVWRGLVGDFNVLYRFADAVNTPATTTVSFTDTGAVTDAVLSLRQVLYTTGGVIENIAPPPSTTAVLHKNRLFLGGLDTTGFIAYSKEFVSGEGVAFSDLFTIPVDPASGNVTALASMDDKLIIFKQDKVYSLVGDGPLDTGAQNDFALPQVISGDVGCITPRSIATIPDGIVFKSDKGIYLLTRALQFIYVGQGVEGYNSLTITSATVLEDLNEVRFTTSDGACLVFNYEFNQWSTFSNYESLSALNGLGAYLHLKSDGTVRKESTAYLDAGGKIKMNIETSWLAFAGLQGYQRVRSWTLLGDFITDHYTKVNCFYDYESFSSETVYFNVDNGLELSYYGDDVTYGDSEVYGGTGSGVFQFTSQPRVQKCQAMKLRIEDIDTKVLGGGGSFNLVGLTLEVGTKNSVTKQMLGNKSVGS